MNLNLLTSPRRTAMLATAIASLSLAACGGGGSSGGGSPSNPANPSADPIARATGPLDPVQAQLESAVLAPLASALAGTPLEGVVDCANELVNHKVLDTVDVLAGALALSANPSDLTSLSQTLNPQLLTERVRAIAFDTAQLLLSLNNQGSSCATLGNSVNGSSGAQQLLSGSNPLAGTPFESIGATVGPAIAQLLNATGGSTPASNLPVSSLIAAYQQFNNTVQSSLAMLPDDVQNAPVVGGALLTVGGALDDLEAVFASLTTFNAAGLQTSLTALLSNIAGNLTTNLIPLGSLESGLGQPGALSGMNALAVGDFGSTLAGLISGGNPVSGLLSQSLLGNLLAPLQDTVLGPIQDLLSLEFGSNPLAPGNTGDLLTNTPLAPVIDVVSGLLGSLLGGGGTGGAPCINLPLLGNLLCPSA
jgi:hypothetical protein